MSYQMTHFKVGKVTILPIINFVLMVILTAIYYLEPTITELALSPLATAIAFAWMMERCHAQYLFDKLEKQNDK
jgi:uncharacterized membrane protein